MKPLKTPGHLASLDLLRGMAAMSVCLFHFTNGKPNFLPDGALKHTGSFGWMGVEAFFVISGFIIPFSLDRSGYRVRDFATFLVKRVARLDPPYLCSIALLLVLGYASALVPGFRGPPVHVTPLQLALHLGYANAFVGLPWLNPVFWTLAIEAQYYVLIGLVFPLLVSRRITVWIVTGAGMILGCFLIPAPAFIFHWLPLFLLGIATFQYRRGAISLWSYLAGLAVLTALNVQTYGFSVALVGLCTACVIALPNRRVPAFFVFLGQISYSLYLLHVPIGGRVVNLGTRFAHTLPLQLLVIMGALSLSTGAAWLFYRFIERPAQRWSASIKYRKREAVAPGI